jgi:hypothetical protein
MESGWVDAGGYALSVMDGKIICRNDKGSVLKSVPSKVKSSDVYEQLNLALQWLDDHSRQCRDAVESWMLRSLPVPRAVAQSVWRDESWRSLLEHAVVRPLGDSDEENVGFFLGVSEKGIGIVNLDGETRWLDAPALEIPHPVLLPNLDDFRELGADLGYVQVLQQLFRQTFVRPAKLDAQASSVNEFANGKFAQLNYALGRCRTLGYAVRGGFACCKVLENGKTCEARYWIGSDYPEYETFTGDLIWVDERERLVPLEGVGPVAYSEGMRMASAIFAGREKEEAAEEN